MSTYFSYLKTEDITLIIAADENALISISRADNLTTEQPNAITLQAQKELKEFFSGKRKSFSIAISPSGSDFDQKVWSAIKDIPYGETRSYAQIARAVGNSKASRAVGNSCHANPLPFIIPCHRVIKTSGRLGNYGFGSRLKERLLILEHINKAAI
ncbi:MAG TPA: methylated-DNA--[protein]-cysteine S-methyltransferase [Bacilli bacterium]|nr:methylated-DNA--[protein]-cysteine S-methyltransferase [Bacilli bacterium]